MTRATYFVQDCPVCGRCLQVRVELLGKTVSCRHCRGAFVARDPSMGTRAPDGDAPDLLGRAQELLSAVDALKPRPR